MASDDAPISPEETLVLIHALEILRRAEIVSLPHLPPVPAVGVDLDELRGKLKQAIRVSMYADASNWMDSELRAERHALGDALISVPYPLLAGPQAESQDD